MPTSVGNISDEAAAARRLLDTIFAHVEKVRAGVKTTHTNTLQETIVLVSSIQYRTALQTPLVAEALSMLRSVLNGLSQLVKQNVSLPQMSGALLDLSNAKSNLKDHMPGDVFIASGNRAIHASQNNSLLGGVASDRRINVTSMDNFAQDANQNNGPSFGDTSYFFNRKK